MSAIYDLRAEVQEYGHTDPDYYQKMMHRIPPADVVERAMFLVRAVKGKSVLDIGCTGQISALLRKAARAYHGLDIVDVPGLDNFIKLNLDDLTVTALPEIPGLELVIASEILEHLSNAGHFMGLVRALHLPVILSVPNAFSEGGFFHASHGIENVNREHVAYYSYFTLTELVERAGLVVREWHWYGGPEYIAEGLIFCLE